MSLVRWRAIVPTLALFAALLVAWQVAGPLFGIRAYLLPSPLAVLRAALDFSIPWHTHIWITTLEIGGFALGAPSAWHRDRGGVVACHRAGARAFLAFAYAAQLRRWRRSSSCGSATGSCPTC
jgi:hypothetical protein